MKPVLFTLALAVTFATGTAVAQTAPPQGQTKMVRRGSMAEHLTRELNLTPDQKKKVEALQPTMMQKMRATGGDETKMRGVIAWQKGEMKKILNAQQWAKYDKMMANVRFKKSGG